MQQRQQTPRAHSANSIHQNDIAQSQRSPSLINPSNTGTPLIRNISARSQADLMIAEAHAPTPPPRDVESTASTSLSETESRQVTDLLSYLAENSYAYDSHVQLVDLLHKGFLAHISPSSDSPEEAPRDPRSYGLLTELRQAREAMDTRFAPGEDIWADWLSDEMLLAASSDERITVTELCQKAVQDEAASVKVWQAYADWVASNHAACNDLDGASQSKWTEEDKEVCKELFTRDMLLSVLEQAVAATRWRIDESHLLWNRYAELVQQDFPASPTDLDIQRLRKLFVQRLQMPHTTWDETAQILWPLVSKHEGSNWEAIMAEVNELAVPAKKAMGFREMHELRFQKAIDDGDTTAAFNELSQYLQWEKKQERKKNRAAFEGELRCTLYERALLRFPTHADWWLDYIDFVLSSNPASALPLIERATRHCPWSGDLWARRILQCDVEGQPYHEIEATKHRATNSGLLDVGGMEEMLKVLQQWCSYLRRHAFGSSSSEDDLDTAELGIRAALEDISEAGKKIYGKDFQGDPLHRLETIQIKFLTESRRLSDAREIYRDLVPLHKDSHAFWAAYYHWELMLWGTARLAEKHRVETAENGPHLATGVVQQALSQRNLDWPEKVLDMYLNHFQQHESGEKLRAALVDARDFSKHLAIRRTKEAEAAADSTAQQQYATTSEQEAAGSTTAAGEKRKRDDDVLPNGYSDKKTKTEDKPAPGAGLGEPSGSASVQIKRDRENNTITVKNLPADVQELDIKKFFRDVSVPLSISIIQDRTGETTTATVEFESHEDVLAAKTRNGKEINGNEVRIQGGSQSTLYVANYPPEHDEAAMRKLFEGYGEVVSVRFPSLKFNNRRRFCYVQFLTTDMARAAEAALDDKMLDGSHKLLAKISDPDAKKHRSGAQAEGRELFVKNLDRFAPDHEIKQFFEQYGTVVSMNVVKLVSGKRTGTAFIVFLNTDEATAALAANSKPFHDRILHVEMASAKGRAAPLDRARKEDVIIKQAASASPEPDGQNGRRGSDMSVASSAQQADDSWKTAKERKIAIFNLPDTVNDARVRAAMEEHGALVKIQMRRQDNGAIVEFANINDSFHVRQGVDCSSLGPEVRTGDVADLLAKVKKRQGDGEFGGVGSTTMRPPTVSRPGQRGGRRGGLGYRRGGGFGVGSSGSNEGSGANAGNAKGAGGAKSNADFRTMFEKGKEE